MRVPIRFSSRDDIFIFITQKKPWSPLLATPLKFSTSICGYLSL